MDHLIRFRTAEGIDGSHVAASLDEAVTFVERLRNAEGATDVRLFRLTEVAIEFKPYYRVEVGGVEASGDAPTATAQQPTMAYAGHGNAAAPAPFAERGHLPPADPAAMAPPDLPEAQTANGRRLFSRV